MASVSNTRTAFRPCNRPVPGYNHPRPLDGTIRRWGCATLAILFYDYVPDAAERRAPHRPAHLAMLTELHEAGKLRLAGAYADPLDGAAIVFSDRATAERFVERDPYVANGVVSSYRIRDWNVVIGE